MDFIFAPPFLVGGASPPPDGVSLSIVPPAVSLVFVNKFGNTAEFTGFFHRLSLTHNVSTLVFSLVDASSFGRFFGTGG